MAPASDAPPPLRTAACATGTAPGRRLLDPLRERVHYLHCSIRAEEAYVHWVRALPSWLAVEHHLSVSTHRPLLFLYPAGGALRSPLDSLLPT
jgi:hypothetical protein